VEGGNPREETLSGTRTQGKVQADDPPRVVTGAGWARKTETGTQKEKGAGGKTRGGPLRYGEGEKRQGASSPGGRVGPARASIVKWKLGKKRGEGKNARG